MLLSGRLRRLGLLNIESEGNMKDSKNRCWINDLNDWEKSLDKEGLMLKATTVLICISIVANLLIEII